MTIRAPTMFKVILHTSIIIIQKKILLRVISEKSAPEVGFPISDFSGKINGWAQRREAIRAIRGVGFGWFLEKKHVFERRMAEACSPKLIFGHQNELGDENLGAWIWTIMINEKIRKNIFFEKKNYFFHDRKNIFLEILKIWKNLTFWGKMYPDDQPVRRSLSDVMSCLKI